MKAHKMDCVLQCTYTASPGAEIEIVSQVGLTYLAEGAAHVVYRITLPGTAATTHPQFVGKLFRFRKAIPSAVPCAQTVSNFQRRIVPLFPENSLVNLELHDVPDQSALIAKLNAALVLRERNGSRPVQRRGVYLTPSEEEPNDILVTDMCPRGLDERLIEFKPKWLVQSPSAPSGSRRCRTCALREMRTDDERRTGDRHSGRGHADFCPLDLLSSDDDVLEETISLLSLTNEFTRTYVSIFKKQLQPLLVRLRNLQAEHNNVGLDNFENGQDQDFSLSMALRDCSVFIKSKRGDVGFQEVRLADLDLKSGGGGKLETWASTERRLVVEGWYMGIENADSRGQRYCRALQTS
jgi:inositol-pentakisphosphate 2-kinase